MAGTEDISWKEAVDRTIERHMEYDNFEFTPSKPGLGSMGFKGLTREELERQQAIINLQGQAQAPHELRTGYYGGLQNVLNQSVAIGHTATSKPDSELKGLAAWLPKIKTDKKEKKMGFVKEYFSKHRELFMGLAMALILDRYLLGGAFQERLKRIITGILDKTEGALALPDKTKV